MIVLVLVMMVSALSVTCYLMLIPSPLTAFVGAIRNVDLWGRSGKVPSVPYVRPPKTIPVWLSS
jgi:hypothetical protein